jgi:hypothetical protein
MDGLYSELSPQELFEQANHSRIYLTPRFSTTMLIRRRPFFTFSNVPAWVATHSISYSVHILG